MRMVFAMAALAAGCHGMREMPASTDDSTLAVLGKDQIACGAVALTRDLAVTANHCVPETVVNYLMAPDGQLKTRTGRGFVVVRDPASDLALFATTHLVPAELRDAPPEVDGVVSMVAHVPNPWGVVAIHPSEVDEGFVRTERLRVGASGSGLWDSDWRLIGIAIGNDNHAGYFASARLVNELVRHVPRDARGRIQTSSEPKICGNIGLGERAVPEHPEGVNVPKLLDKVNEKKQRIDVGLADVQSRVEAENR